MLTRTGAKGQQTQYDYDQFGRRTEVRHYTLLSPGNTLIEQPNQRVDYVYDTADAVIPGFSQNAVGRLAAVTFANESLGGHASRGGTRFAGCW